MRALEHRRARRRRYVEDEDDDDHDEDEPIVSQRRQLGFLKYADPPSRKSSSTREHAKQIAMALSHHEEADGMLFADFGSAFDDPTESTTQSSWNQQHHPFGSVTVEETEPDLFAPQWESAPSTTTTTQRQRGTSRSTTPVKLGSSRARVATPPPNSQSASTASHSTAAARRRMRQTMRSKHVGGGGGDTSSVYDDAMSFASGSLWPSEETAAQITPRSAQQAFFEPKQERLSGGSSRNSSGFDAFGLVVDGGGSSRKARSATTATTAPSTMMLQHDLIDGFADWGDSPTTSSVEEDDTEEHTIDAAAETFVVHKPPVVTAVVETSSSKLPSERSSLTADDVSDHHGANSTSPSTTGINMFKQQAGFHTQTNKPRRKVVRPGNGSIRTESTAATTVETTTVVARPKLPEQPTHKSPAAASSRLLRSAVERQQQRTAQQQSTSSSSGWNAFAEESVATSTQSDHGAASASAWNAFPASSSPRFATDQQRPTTTSTTQSEGGTGWKAPSPRQNQWRAFPSTSPSTAAQQPWKAFDSGSSTPSPRNVTTSSSAQKRVSSSSQQPPPWNATFAATSPSPRSTSSRSETGTATTTRRSFGVRNDTATSSTPEQPPKQRPQARSEAGGSGGGGGWRQRVNRGAWNDRDATTPAVQQTQRGAVAQARRSLFEANAKTGNKASSEGTTTTAARSPSFRQTERSSNIESQSSDVRPTATTAGTNRIRERTQQQLVQPERQSVEQRRRVETQQQPQPPERQVEAEPVTEPKPLTYKERRELELKQRQPEKQLQQQQQEKQPQDIREQIKRRVAAAKQKQPEAAAAAQSPAVFSPSTTEFSDIRNRLRPTGQRGDGSLQEKPQLSSANMSQTSSLENRSSSNSTDHSPRSFATDRISPRTQSSPRESPRVAAIRTDAGVAQRSPMSKSPQRLTPRSNADNNASSFSGQPPSPLESVRSSLQGRLSREVVEEQELPWERPRVEDSCAADLAMEPSSSQEEQQQQRQTAAHHQEPVAGLNKQAAAAALSQSLLMKQLQSRQQPPPKQGPPKALSVATSDATSENVSEDRNRTPKATMMMLNAFLAGRDSVASSDGPVAPAESNEIEEVEPSEGRKSPTKHSLPPLKDDPKYEKYFKMMKVGMPMDVVKHSMTRDGLDPSVIDGDHNKPVGIPLKDDPDYAKYFRMLKIGLPMDAVKHSMERDGLDSAVLDQDHDLPAASQKSQDTEPKEQDSHRRARLHWKTLRKVTSNSLWARIEKDTTLNIKIDEEEFQELFQADRSAPSAPSVVQRGGSSKQKPSVCVIEAKRANNGGIILARLKMSHDDMADAVDRIDENAMTTEQIENIIEYLPSKEEKRALESYMLGGGQDAAEKFDALCECEKFMVSMMTVKHAKRKVSAILFKLQFETCVRDIQKEACMIDKACNELHDSVRLRQLLGIILTFGNRLNTAGNGKRRAGAFTLDSLLKLRQAKAFDKKTTFLHYIVSIVQRNNDDLLDFGDDLGAVFQADKIYWDQCIADLEQVEHQLENVRKIALYQSHQSHGYRLRKKTRKDDPDESLTDDDEDLTLEEEVENLRATPIGMFTLSAIKYISQLREKVECTKTMFKKLLEYFGEEESAMQPHELFSTIVRFCKDFEKAKHEVIEKQKRKQREEQRQQSGATPSPKTRTPAKQSHPPGMLLKASSHQPNMGSVLRELKTTPFKLRRTTSGGVETPQQTGATEPKERTARSDVGPSPRSRGVDPSAQSASFRYTTPDKRHVSSPEEISEQAVRRVVHHNASSTASSSATSAMRAKAKLRLHHSNAEPVSPTRRSRGSIACDDDVGAQQPVSPRQAPMSTVVASSNSLSPRSSIRMKRRVQQRSRNRTGFH